MVTLQKVKLGAQILNKLLLVYSQAAYVSTWTLCVLSLQGKRVVSEQMEKSSPAGQPGTKHSTEGRGTPLDTTAGGRDCLKKQVTYEGIYVCTNVMVISVFLTFFICLLLMC